MSSGHTKLSQAMAATAVVSKAVVASASEILPMRPSRMSRRLIQGNIIYHPVAASRPISTPILSGYRSRLP